MKFSLQSKEWSKSISTEIAVKFLIIKQVFYHSLKLTKI